MRALKAIVIGMGILIALSIILLAYGLYKKSADPTWKLFGKPTVASANSVVAVNVVAPFDDINLGLASGCRVMDVTSNGPLAYFRVGPDSVCEAVIVIDVAQARILGRIIPR